MEVDKLEADFVEKKTKKNETSFDYQVNDKFCGCFVAKSCLNLCNPMDCSPLGSSLCPWDFPGKNTGVGCHIFLQGIFPTKGSNPCQLQKYFKLKMTFFGNLFFLLHIPRSQTRSPTLSNLILLAFSCAYHLVGVSVTELGFVLLKGDKILKILS